MCGELVCGQCSPHRVQLGQDNFVLDGPGSKRRRRSAQKAVRVCTDCYVMLSSISRGEPDELALLRKTRVALLGTHTAADKDPLSLAHSVSLACRLECIKAIVLTALSSVSCKLSERVICASQESDLFSPLSLGLASVSCSLAHRSTRVAAG